MEKYLRTIGEKVLDIAGKRGVVAETFLLYDRELSLDLMDGRVDTLKEAEEIGMGLRVINQGRLGFAYTSDLSDRALQKVVDDATSISRYTVADENNVLPSPVSAYPHLEIFDEGISSRSLESKIEMAREIERAAKSSDSRISIVERAGYEDSEYSTLIMNSNGLYAFGKANLAAIYISLVAEENGDAQNGFSMMIKKKIGDLQPEFVGREAAHNAVRSLHASTIDSALMPCVMEPYVVNKFLGILSRMVDAEAVQKGKSMFAGKEGEVVASEAFSLLDDAAFEGGIGSFPFDGEGVPAQRNMIIENGILKAFLHDSYTAQKAGTVSTGNGHRGSFRSLPAVGTSNFILQSGKRSPEGLISEIEKGFYVTELMGVHTANPISGDFSLGASGIMIENGNLSYPVRGLTIAGNIASLLQDIEAVGSDLRFYGGRAAPTIRLKSLSIGGK